MNLSRPNGNDGTQTVNRSRNVVPGSGICSRCLESCTGNCEVFKSSFRGREVIYPSPYGEMTAGADKDYPVDYSHLNIHGYAQGAKGLPGGVKGDSDHAIFPAVDTDTEYGVKNRVKMKLPVFTGALGSTDIARKSWDQIAVGAAISGISLVCGENVCGIDPGLKLGKNGKVTESPELKRRVEIYHQWREGFGDLMVQMNVEDTRLGVAEYAVSELGVETIELKWGQGAKCIGGEIKVRELERAQELKHRGYIVTPDPDLKEGINGFKQHSIREFERHSRLGFVDEDGFYKEVERLRKLGAKRVTLKTGAYGQMELAMALKWGSNAKIDLLTIDGAPGGTGMSPWRMMCEWGIPTFYLQAMACRFADRLKSKRKFVPDLAMAGGFSLEDHIFKVLAMGAPYFKAVCMGRALMIPGFVGKNIDAWVKEGKLPKSISPYGDKPEEIFITYEILRNKYGDKMKEIPLGAIALYTFVDRLKVGLQQLMAGSRNFNLLTISRADVFSLTEEAARISGIPYVMEQNRKEAEKILDA